MLWGLYRGLGEEVCGLSVWIGAGFLTWLFQPAARQLMEHFFPKTPLPGWIAGIILFVLLRLTLGIVAGRLSLLIRQFFSIPVDALLGGIFGALRGWVICLALYSALMTFLPEKTPLWLSASPWLPELEASMQLVHRWQGRLDRQPWEGYGGPSFP